ncbi:MAG: peptidylprolyl isomerase, partial [Minicystis sp.]
EACLRAVEARDRIRGGADFGEIVKQYSDEPGAATREGSIGAVERKDVLQPFADAAFELSIHQMSDVVETESGFHLIFRTQ